MSIIFKCTADTVKTTIILTLILTFVNSETINGDSERDYSDKDVYDEHLSDIFNIASGIQYIELFDVFFYPLHFYCLSTLCFNPHLDPKESIIPSTVKMFSKSELPHHQKYDLSSSGVYSSSDLENKAPLCIPSYDKIHPMSSDTEGSLYDREFSPSPLQLCHNHLSAASISLQNKHHKKQSPLSDKQINLDQNILKGNDMNVFTYPLHLEFVHLII